MFRTSHLLAKLALVALVLGALGAIYLDARITGTFNDKMWGLAAKVYARPLELFAGAEVSPADLSYELDLLGYRSVSAPGKRGEVARDGNRIHLYARGFNFPGEQEPERQVVIEFSGNRVDSMSSGGRAVDLMRLEPVQIGGIFPQHGEDRVLVQLADVPEHFRQALLAVEDRNFYHHWGFSFLGIARAAVNNLLSGQVVAGGSTITQQLVKNFYLTSERTIVRKLTELVMAVLLELHYEKDLILETYINEVYLGQEGPRAVHGFALAAQHYFGKPLDQLQVHQQALLIGMIKGPSLYNPERNPERALQRRNVVLGVMAEQGVISPEQAAAARARPLDLNMEGNIRGAVPAYLDLVRRQLRQEYREEDLTTKGLSIFTAFDPLLQRQLERSTAAVLDQLDTTGKLQSASVVTRFDTGEVAALTGGRTARFAGFNRALDARRPAGSLLKSAIYLAALEQPRQYSLATVLSDTPITIKAAGAKAWQPQNFDKKVHGDVLLYQALAQSYNLASARLGMNLGINTVVDVLARLGVEQGVPRLPALMLGAGEYSVMDMALMYQTIAAGGFRMPLRSIRDIVDASGEPLRRYPLEYDRTVNLQAVHLLHYALRAVVREGTGQGVYRYLPESFAVAGKTGTTNDGRDSWFAGFSGDLLAVSWIGRDDNNSTGLTGGSGALKIWAQFMAGSSKQSLAYRMPDGIQTHWIDDRSGYLTGEGCPNARRLPFIADSEPRQRTDCASRGEGSGARDWFDALLGRY